MKYCSSNLFKNIEFFIVTIVYIAKDKAKQNKRKATINIEKGTKCSEYHKITRNITANITKIPKMSAIMIMLSILCLLFINFSIKFRVSLLSSSLSKIDTVVLSVARMPLR